MPQVLLTDPVDVHARLYELQVSEECLRKGGEVICELSHPVSIDASGYVDEWDERIILTAIPLDPARMPVLDAPPVESEVVIRRREA